MRSNFILRPRNLLISGIIFTLIVEKATAQTQPPLPGPVVNQAIGPGTIGQQFGGNIAQWANVQAANGIYAQMRAGQDIVLRSELFTSVAFVSLFIAAIMLMFRLTQWLLKCNEARVIVPVDPVQLLTPLFLILLLARPVGTGFTAQTVVVGTGDLLNSFQTYILSTGSKATLAGGSAVRQANTKAQVEQSIILSQVTCAATLNQEERQVCYDDAFNSVSKMLDPFRNALWARSLSDYADQTLLRNGKFATQGSNIGSAIGGIAGAAGKIAVESTINFASGWMTPGVMSMILVVSSAFGILVGVIQMLASIFFPLSIALSFAPIFEGSWIKWFTGTFQIWIAGLFMRMLITILAIITVSGSSVSGGLYVVSVLLVSLTCGVMAVVSIISTTAGIAGNVSNNIANLK